MQFLSIRTEDTYHNFLIVYTKLFFRVKQEVYRPIVVIDLD